MNEFNSIIITNGWNCFINYNTPVLKITSSPLLSSVVFSTEWNVCIYISSLFPFYSFLSLFLINSILLSVFIYYSTQLTLSLFSFFFFYLNFSLLIRNRADIFPFETSNSCSVNNNNNKQLLQNPAV